MNIEESLKAMGRSSIELKIAGKDEYKTGATRFGGQPDVPPGFVWPSFLGENADGVVKSRPLSFLAQFNCADLAQYDTEHLLPDHGLLSFFYEMDTHPWGFDPKDKGCARVYWFEDTTALSAANFPEALANHFRFPMVKIKLSPKTSYPSWEDFSNAFPEADDDDIFYATWDELTETDTDTYSQLLGWPNVIQSSMFTECDLVTQGYYLGDETGWSRVSEDARKQADEIAMDRWTLLLQLDTVQCENFRLMFGDCGHLYFYITREDLQERRFDRVWAILQCY